MELCHFELQNHVNEIAQNFCIFSAFQFLAYLGCCKNIGSLSAFFERFPESVHGNIQTRIWKLVFELVSLKFELLVWDDLGPASAQRKLRMVLRKLEVSQTRWVSVYWHCFLRNMANVARRQISSVWPVTTHKSNQFTLAFTPRDFVVQSFMIRFRCVVIPTVCTFQHGRSYNTN